MGQGDGGGLRALETPLGRLGGSSLGELHAARPLRAVRVGVEIYVASTADDADEWQATLVHIAVSRAASSSPRATSSARPRTRTTSRSQSSSTAATSSVAGERGPRPRRLALQGPLYGEEGILYAELDPARLVEERQRSTRRVTTTARTSSGSR